jgi:hypothetical protein
MHTAKGRHRSDGRARSGPLAPGMPASEGARNRAMGRYAAVVTAYLCLNSSLNVMNRWLLGVHAFKCAPLFSLRVVWGSSRGGRGAAWRLGLMKERPPSVRKVLGI